MTRLIISPAAAKYLKKIKDKNLKDRFQDAIDKIVEDTTVGDSKTGDLEGLSTYGFRYDKTDYRVAYTVEYVDDKVVVVILAGTHENFYKELKKYWK